MKTITTLVLFTLALGLNLQAADLASAPPVVVRTVPESGSSGVDAKTTSIVVTFSKAMRPGSWSWVTESKETFPEIAGKPRYKGDGKTAVLPVKLEPGRHYRIWVNSSRFRNFKDKQGRPAVPYLLNFDTAKE